MISIEGIEASGKTMCARYCTKVLKRTYGAERVFYTYEPTRTNMYGKLANKFLERKYHPVWEWETFFLFLMDRAIHVKNLIKPKIDQGRIIICDRYIHSQLAYQAAEGVPLSILVDFNKNFPIPDIVFLLDISPETAIKRLDKRYEQEFGLKEYFDEHAILQKVRQHYLEIQKNLLLAHEIIIIDADKPKKHVLSALYKELMALEMNDLL